MFVVRPLDFPSWLRIDRAAFYHQRKEAAQQKLAALARTLGDDVDSEIGVGDPVASITSTPERNRSGLIVLTTRPSSTALGPRQGTIMPGDVPLLDSRARHSNPTEVGGIKRRLRLCTVVIPNRVSAPTISCFRSAVRPSRLGSAAIGLERECPESGQATRISAASARLLSLADSAALAGLPQPGGCRLRPP
jgi:hypothetical protein